MAGVQLLMSSRRGLRQASIFMGTKVCGEAGRQWFKPSISWQKIQSVPR
jgi:hypothetical protein